MNLKKEKTMTAEAENKPLTAPNGWVIEGAIQKWWRGKHVRLYRLHKPCGECGAEMQIDVTRNAVEGKAKNAGLKLTRCAGCRARATAMNVSSRPKVNGEPVNPRQHTFTVSPLELQELDQLRTANATMKEELAGLYAENRTLRATLAKYELAPATAAVANGAAPKMPWEK